MIAQIQIVWCIAIEIDENIFWNTHLIKMESRYVN